MFNISGATLTSGSSIILKLLTNAITVWNWEIFADFHWFSLKHQFSMQDIISALKVASLKLITINFSKKIYNNTSLSKK